MGDKKEVGERRMSWKMAWQIAEDYWNMRLPIKEYPVAYIVVLVNTLVNKTLAEIKKTD